jgi:hypothetical protein
MLPSQDYIGRALGAIKLGIASNSITVFLSSTKYNDVSAGLINPY